jgi:hypothetical protein
MGLIGDHSATDCRFAAPLLQSFLRDALGGWSPDQFRGPWADEQKPSGFPGDVPIVPLLNLADPLAPANLEPASLAWGRDVVGPIGFRVRGVFKYSAPATNRSQGRGKAAAIVAGLVGLLERGSITEPAPSFTRRVSDHRMRAKVELGVPPDIPWVHAGKATIAAVGFDENRSDQFRLRGGCVLDRIKNRLWDGRNPCGARISGK